MSLAAWTVFEDSCRLLPGVACAVLAYASGYDEGRLGAELEKLCEQILRSLSSLC